MILLGLVSELLESLGSLGRVSLEGVYEVVLGIVGESPSDPCCNVPD